ncbi:hypothetical protein [Micromonospora sp. WMMD987]|uniref:hypothetical protein n=1 Tax=Micromonospora TaxID=1873 RepID=UPI00249C7637|nr:hypothetical protein [Micromonospora sp. WMMD987]WFE95484.1 hypothetical protein O7612_00615 [Micromonospora sp. WMMD987]
MIGRACSACWPGCPLPLRPLWVCRACAEATEHLTQLANGRRIDVTDRFLAWVRPPDH